MITPPPRSPLFPYTTLFRSNIASIARNLNKDMLDKINSNMTPGKGTGGPGTGGGEGTGHGTATGPGVGSGKGTLSERVKRMLRSEEHTSELQSRRDLVCRLL